MPEPPTALGRHAASPVELQQQLEADRAGDPYLLFRDDDGAQHIVTLAAGRASASIGRGPRCEVPLDWDCQVSVVHAELDELGGVWTVVDDGLSRNGTFVNGQRVSGRRRLRDGDVIGVGMTAIMFRAPGPAQASTVAETIPRPRLSEAQRRVLVALCRPFGSGTADAAPATNREIAEELFLGMETVKTHMRALFESFEVEDLPQHRKRARLVFRAFQSGAVILRDL